ncbi:nnp-1 protein putative nuclear protein 1 nop52 [Anaeramoeba flamelloides]|uniref:Nnp-1 protein putative nuclear protein 1 nop52 n=1 Tax=Anaeramoeba flamelloides TaxID=1746091 RepID=A0ABQ8Z0P2_9EUKA|nr:nnp-1 protein putative nuclear protein 1 nop52 [Anaeramoeba flamelloides]
MRKVINYYTELMILARIIYLIWLLEKNPQLSPQQFINLQLDSGSSRIDEIYYELIDKFEPINFLGSTLEICDLFITKLNTLLKERKFLKLYIALDEANTLTKDSRFILSKRKLEKRGIIKPIFFTFNKICFRSRFQLIVSGTALSLSDFDQQVLNRLKIELSGRPRWVCRFISELWKYLDKNNNNNDNNNNNNNNKLVIDKNEVLINILDEKIYKIAENDLGNKLKRIEKEEKLKPLGKILQDLFYEYILQNKTSFKPNLIGETSESNEKLWLKILDQGFFYLKQDKGNEFHYIPSDYLALYVLKKHYTTLDILKDKIIQMWEMEQENYGTAFEWLIFYQLMKFNGLKISELPFFDQVKEKDQKKLPKWIRESTINIQYYSKNQNGNQNYSNESNQSGAKQDLNMLINSTFKHHNSIFNGKNQIYIFPSHSKINNNSANINNNDQKNNNNQNKRRTKTKTKNKRTKIKLKIFVDLLIER